MRSMVAELMLQVFPSDRPWSAEENSRRSRLYKEALCGFVLSADQEIIRLQAEIELRQSPIELLGRDKAAADGEVKRLVGELEVLAADRDRHFQESAARQSSLEELGRDKAAADGEVKRLIGELEVLAADRDRHFQESVERLNAIRSIQADKRVADNEVARLAAGIESATSVIRNGVDEIRSLRAENQGLRDEVNGLHSENERLRTRLLLVQKNWGYRLSTTLSRSPFRQRSR
jgi:chromosome segregation ATPase